MKYPHLFSPMTIGNVTFKNRIFTAPASPQKLLAKEAYPTDALIGYYREKAKGGSAAVSVSCTMIDSYQPEDPIRQNLRVDNLAYGRHWVELTSQVHFFDAKVNIELMTFHVHGRDEHGNIVKYSPSGDYDDETGEWCPPIPVEEMERIAEEYAYAAECAAQVGFDGILIHGAHGLFLHRMMSPLSNKRTDAFGGSMENRARFALQILNRIRERVGNRLYIEYRVSGSELLEGGFDVADCIDYLRLIEDYVDIAHISAGIYHGRGASPHICHPTIFLQPGHNTYLSAAVKQSGVRLPVVTLGGFQEPALMEEILAAGSADFIAMARGTIADAALPNKVRAGKESEVVPCIKCLYCWDYMRHTEFGCAVNPTVGREVALRSLVAPADETKRVVIIGGGPAGMQAAVVASQRGHKTTLIEQRPALGGQLIPASAAPFKVDLGRFVDYLIRSVENAPIDVRLGTRATPELVASLKPDVVLAAIGSHPVKPPIPGLELTIPVLDYYDNPDVVGGEGKIVIIGGGLAGCETAVFLGMSGRDVTLLEMSPEVATNEPWISHVALMEKMDQYVKYHTSARCTRVSREGVNYVGADSGEHFIAAEHVILASGMIASHDDAERFRSVAPIFRRIGDCLSAGDVRNATRTAFDAAASC